MVRAARRYVAVLAAAAAAGALCACSNSGAGGPAPTFSIPTTASTSSSASQYSASDLATAALSDMQGARSFHVQASSVTKNVTTLIDMRYAQTGSTGTITVDKVVVQLIGAKGATYVKAPTGFWKSELTATQVANDLPNFGDKWVRLPGVGTLASQFDPITNQQQILTSLVANDNATAYLRGVEKTVDGTKAIALIDHADNAVIYVSATGKPYPVQATGTRGKAKFTANFSDWNAGLTVTAPSASQTYVLSG